MAAETRQWNGVRREERVETVRVVEFSRFPRIAPDASLRVGFTRDLSNSGMCLGVDESEAVGTLLRVSVRDLEGVPSEPRIGRVVWSEPARDGRCWMGIELLTAALSPRAAAHIRRQRTDRAPSDRLRV